MLDPQNLIKIGCFFPETTAFLTAFEKVNLVSSQRAFWSCFYGHNPLSIFIPHWYNVGESIYKGGEGGQWI